MGKEVILDSRRALDSYIQHLTSQWERHKYLRVSCKTGKQRTLTQNAALHLYCQHLADAFNDAGLDMVMVLSAGTDIPWSAAKVKDDIWRKVQIAVTGKESTTKPEVHEYGEIYEVINRHVSESFGLFVPWPSKDK